jgi:hypothetical protein
MSLQVSRSVSATAFDRVAATCAALTIIGLVLFLLVRNQPVADPQLYVALRIILSLGAAILGATIPGFLHLEWKGAGLVVRAGGALALCVLTFVYTPGLPDPPAARPSGPTVSAPNGVAIGRDVSGGTFNIGPPARPPEVTSTPPPR